MKFNYLILALLCTLIAFSCDEGCLIPDPDDNDNYAVGDTIWIHETPVVDSMFIGNSLAIGTNGDIYYYVSGVSWKWNNARIVALDRETGDTKWISEKMDHMTGIGGEIVVADDGIIYVIGWVTLYGFDPQTGATVLKWELPETLPYKDYDAFVKNGMGHLALTDDGNLVFGSVSSGVYHRSLYCVDPSTSSLIWYNIDASNWGVPSGIYIGQNNTAYYYSALTVNQVENQYLVAIDVLSGNIKWKTQVASNMTGSNNIAIQGDGNLLCTFALPGEEPKYHIVDGANGNIIWTSSANGSGHQKTIGPDGAFHDCYGYGWGIHNINSTTGESENIVPSQFGSIADNNTLVCAFTDADNIRKLGVFYPDGLIDFSVPMAGLQGHQIVIDDQSWIYGIINLHPSSLLPTKICAIKGKASLAKSGWPRPHHDNRNTSNWSKY